MNKRMFAVAVIGWMLLSSVSLGYSGGDGTAGNPYQIANANDLLGLGADTGNYGKSFILTADIDLDPNLPGGQIYTTAIIAPDRDSVNGGFQGSMFGGSFNGNGHKIYNLTIAGIGNDHIGLFGFSYGTINNLGLVNVNIRGRNFIGGVLGNGSGIIQYCYVTGAVSGENYGGGLAGRKDTYGAFDCCYTKVTVSGTNDNFGGVVGSGGKLVRCYAAGTVSGKNMVGGLAGLLFGSGCEDCYATGSVNGTDYVGGLIGRSLASVINCYSTGKVSAVTDTFSGGLIGFHDAGRSMGCFWDMQTSGLTDSAGGTGKTTEEMKTLSTFISAGWDFTNETANRTSDTWRMCVDNIDYPRLNWESTESDFICPDGVSSEDLGYFVGQWLLNNCTINNNYCSWADMNTSGKVDIGDYAILARHWLEGM